MLAQAAETPEEPLLIYNAVPGVNPRTIALLNVRNGTGLRTE